MNKPYGVMIAEQACGLETYTPEQLADAARREADINVRTFSKEAVAEHRGRTEYERVAERPDAVILPGGVIEFPVQPSTGEQ